jgi:hypothetical protein
MFHNHTFIFNDITKQYSCSCGKHYCQHIWEEYLTISNSDRKCEVGKVLKCKICGELKNHYVND